VRTLRALVVDDSAFNRKLIAEILESRAFEKHDSVAGATPT